MSFNHHCRYRGLAFQDVDTLFYISTDPLLKASDSQDPFTVCEDCYNFCIIGTPFESLFVHEAPPKPLESLVTCVFSEKWNEGPWLETLRVGNLTPLKEHVEKIQEQEAALMKCPAPEGKQPRLFALPDSEFRLCETCLWNNVEGSDKSAFIDAGRGPCDLNGPQALKGVAVLMSAISAKDMNIFREFGTLIKRFPEHCTGKITPQMCSFSLLDNGTPIPTFRVCQACAVTCVAHFSHLRNDWTEIPAGDNAPLCALGFNRPERRVKYVIKLLFSMWKDDPKIFVDYAKQISAIPSCPTIFPSSGHKWYTTDHLADFDVCEGCFEFLVRNTTLEHQFRLKTQIEAPSTAERSCDMFGARTRTIYAEACAARDPASWIHWMRNERPSLLQFSLSQVLLLRNEISMLQQQLATTQIQQMSANSSARISTMAGIATGINYNGDPTYQYNAGGGWYGSLGEANGAQDLQRSNELMSRATQLAGQLSLKNEFLENIYKRIAREA